MVYPGIHLSVQVKQGDADGANGHKQHGGQHNGDADKQSAAFLIAESAKSKAKNGIILHLKPPRFP